MTISLKYYSSYCIHQWSKEGLFDHAPHYAIYSTLKAIKFASFLFILGVLLTVWGFVKIAHPKSLPMNQFNVTGELLQNLYNFSGHSMPTLQLAHQALAHDHPLHNSFPRGTLNYTYGTHRTFLNCQRASSPPYTTLPSILRSLSFYQDAQTLMRIALLLAFHMRIHLCWSVTSLAAIRMKTSLTNFFSFALPILEIPWMLFAMFILMFHHSIDYEWSYFFDKIVSIFGVLFGLYGSAYVVFTIIRNQKNLFLLVVRVVCLIIFLSTIFAVQKSFTPFMKEKPCHSLVEYKEALLEYAAFFSIFLFLSTQLVELKSFIMVISSVPNENVTNDEFHELIGCFWQTNYYPAYLFNS